MPRQAAAPRRRAAPAPRRRAPARAPARKPAPARRAPPKKRSEAGNAFRSAGSSVGTMLGNVLGGPAGGSVGGMIGRGAGAVLSKIFGHGDYQVSNISAVSQNNLLTNAANVPQFGTGKVACNFKHREFLGDVFSSSTIGAFNIIDYPINPGQAVTFPWLSQVVGASFQQYRINGMTFEFRSMSSDALNSTNTALGSVIMSTDYDSADLTFTSKQEMENTEYGVSCKPSVNMLHAIECARGQTPVSELYIRSFAVPSGKDIRMYDMGRFSIATVGCQAASVNLGELWVTYDIDAFKAIEQPPLYIAPVSEYTLNGVDATHAMGTSQTVIVDQIGLTFTNSGSYNTVSLPSTISKNSVYEIVWYLYGASTALVPYPAVTYSNGLVLFSDYVEIPYTGTMTSSIKALSHKFKYTGTSTPAAPPTITIANALVPATLTAAALTISQISSSFVYAGTI